MESNPEVPLEAIGVVEALRALLSELEGHDWVGVGPLQVGTARAALQLYDEKFPAGEGDGE